MENESFDIRVRATISHVSAYPISQKAIDAGFKQQRIREEYSDQLLQSVNTFAHEHGLKVDYKKDW